MLPFLMISFKPIQSLKDSEDEQDTGDLKKKKIKEEGEREQVVLYFW